MEDIRSDLKEEIKKEIEKEIREIVKNDILEELRQDLKRDLKKDIKNDILADIRADSGEEKKTKTGMNGFCTLLYYILLFIKGSENDNKETAKDIVNDITLRRLWTGVGNFCQWV